MVEFALVAPVFFMVVLGIIEFGRAMMVAQMLENASREAARLAIIPGSTNQEVEQRAKDMLQSAGGISSSDVTVTITLTPGQGSQASGNQLNTAEQGDMCNVEVTVPFDKVSYIPGDYLDGKTLKGYASMRHE